MLAINKQRCVCAHLVTVAAEREAALAAGAEEAAVRKYSARSALIRRVGVPDELVRAHVHGLESTCVAAVGSRGHFACERRLGSAVRDRPRIDEVKSSTDAVRQAAVAVAVAAGLTAVGVVARAERRGRIWTVVSCWRECGAIATAAATALNLVKRQQLRRLETFNKGTTGSHSIPDRWDSALCIACRSCALAGSRPGMRRTSSRRGGAQARPAPEPPVAQHT